MASPEGDQGPVWWYQEGHLRGKLSHDGAYLGQFLDPGLQSLQLGKMICL